MNWRTPIICRRFLVGKKTKDVEGVDKFMPRQKLNFYQNREEMRNDESQYENISANFEYNAEEVASPFAKPGGIPYP